MDAVESVRQQCHKLGQETPDGVEHEEIVKKLYEIIRSENFLSDISGDAIFPIASIAFAEGFNGLPLGGMAK